MVTVHQKPGKTNTETNTRHHPEKNRKAPEKTSGKTAAYSRIPNAHQKSGHGPALGAAPRAQRSYKRAASVRALPSSG
jgi:hypothetical protein